MFRTEDRWMNLLSWIHSVLLFSGIYLPLAGIFGKPEKDAVIYLLGSLWLFIPVISSWLFIRKIKGFLGYLLSGMVVVIVTGFLSGNMVTVILSVLILIIRAYVRVLQGRLKNPDMPGEATEKELWEIPTVLDEPKVFYWIIFIVWYFLLIFLRRNELLKWMFGLLLAEIFVTYIFKSLSQMKRYIVDNCHIAHLPIKVMQRMQRAVLGITFLVLVIVVLPSVFYGEEPLTGIMNLNLNLDFSIEAEDLQGMPTMADPAEAMEEMFGIEPKEPNKALEMVLNVITYVLAAVVIVGLVFGVWQVCRNMMNTFAEGHGTDEVILLDDPGESLVSKLRKARRNSDRKSSRQKIRRAYKKIIQKRVKGNPMGWETPEELEQKAGLEVHESQKVLHEIYEKARYSMRECDDEDVEVFVNLKKQVIKK